MERAKILVVDDEKKLVKLISAYLEKEGFAVEAAYDGRSALERFAETVPDLVVLDIMLPGIDGIEICRRVRGGEVGKASQARTPIIMLTARVEEVDKLVGLEIGADDYVTKPFSPRELVARIKAVLRRARSATDAGAEPSAPMVRGPLVIERSKHSVKVEGAEVMLTPTEFEILGALAERPGQVFSRGQLLAAAQGEYYEGYERTIDTHVKNIRRKLKETGVGREFIDTVHGVGYRFTQGEV